MTLRALAESCVPLFYYHRSYQESCGVTDTRTRCLPFQIAAPRVLLLMPTQPLVLLLKHLMQCTTILQKTR